MPRGVRARRPRELEGAPNTRKGRLLVAKAACMQHTDRPCCTAKSAEVDRLFIAGGGGAVVAKPVV